MVGGRGEFFPYRVQTSCWRYSVSYLASHCAMRSGECFVPGRLLAERFAGVDDSSGLGEKAVSAIIPPRRRRFY
jgi:hypothetical protein